MNGYIKNLQSISFGKNVDSISTLNNLHNRLNFKFNISSKLSARIELRNRIFYGDYLKQDHEFGNNINQSSTFFNMSKLWFANENIVVHSTIDRLLIQYSLGKWDFKIGRQRINWGLTNLWNPNDIFNAYNILDFDYEERPGNDAIRVQYFLKNNISLDFACKPGKKKDATISALMLKFNKKKYDFQILSGVFNSDVVLGMAWAGNLKDAGFKGEISYFIPHKNLIDTNGIICASLMIDRTFKNNWYSSLAFLYNSNSTDQLLGQNIYISTINAKSLFPFHYNFYWGVIKNFSTITSLNFSTIYSVDKNILIFLPTFSWNVSTNFDLDFTAQSFNIISGKALKNQSNTLYLRLRLSF